MDDWKSLKKLDPTSKNFTANGKEYRIESSLSFDRWMDMQRMEVELSFGTDLQSILKGLKDIYSALNARDKLADASVITKNLILGVSTLDDKRIPTVLRMCALFINYKDEDRTVFTEALAQEKINDWRTEGYEINGFFQLALGSIPGFLSAYSDAIQSGFPSQPEEERSEIMNTASTT